jgi:NAD(P)-dependent dehydrogenase (short-subunit alcohol dehydrogenase family)
MTEFRFDGRVAIVTGAGRGIGRAYALLLAERGATVVVNDLGGSPVGDGADAGPAHDVVEEINAAGGRAVADVNDVSTEASAQAIVATAVDQFGRVDIVVNNAGISKAAGFPDADLDNLERHLQVHVLGSYHVTRAAWPHMVAQGHGRVIMTTSTGMFGLPDNFSYATAKAGLVGMTRMMKIAGAPHDIKINLIAPAAMTRLAGGHSSLAESARQSERPEMSTALVAPMVAYLAHESCPVSGEMYTAGAGRFARLFIASTDGYVQQDPAPTVEDVAEHWAQINDETGYYVPTDLFGWSAEYMKHFNPQGAGASANALSRPPDREEQAS